jgi:nuclear mRNA export protein SAC3
VPPFSRGRGRGAGGHEVNGRGRQSKNRTWVGSGSRSGTNTPNLNHIEGDRWERGGHRGSRGREQNRPRSFPNASLVVPHPPAFENLMSGDEDEDEYQEEDENEQDELNEDVEEPELDTPEAREKFYQEVRSKITVEACNSLPVGSS